MLHFTVTTTSVILLMVLVMVTTGHVGPSTPLDTAYAIGAKMGTILMEAGHQNVSIVPTTRELIGLTRHQFANESINPSTVPNSSSTMVM